MGLKVKAKMRMSYKIESAPKSFQALKSQRKAGSEMPCKALKGHHRDPGPQVFCVILQLLRSLLLVMLKPR